ncbi:FeoB-associated Cys-rich membrane protein [Mobilitalea sibirica]|uniref:FeoB-associated Cys-rich membrane protein n=1 Tax=Mobilitalea sibirica TaxID=1462919 RepID=A0A8J7HBH2_9FIRM|nr:FeoB-associated Cys-rich membrane protein [Mobilitalea sibirica]MBH1939997.1 FeoB-associated Cys-rich membrane protein [Mobilitalea sibirica]
MIDFIIIGIVASVLLLGIISGIRKKKRGDATSCGCSCSGCPSANACHQD